MKRTMIPSVSYPVSFGIFEAQARQTGLEALTCMHPIFTIVV
jgi:hypothetical protein